MEELWIIRECKRFLVISCFGCIVVKKLQAAECLEELISLMMCEFVHYRSIMVIIRRISKFELEIIIRLIFKQGILNIKVDTEHRLATIKLSTGE